MSFSTNIFITQLSKFQRPLLIKYVNSYLDVKFHSRHWCALPEIDSALNISSSLPGYVGDPGGYPSWAVPVDYLDGGITRPSQCKQYKANFTEVSKNHKFSLLYSDSK